MLVSNLQFYRPLFNIDNYEVRSTNKLQIGVILLIFKM